MLLRVTFVRTRRRISLIDSKAKRCFSSASSNKYSTIVKYNQKHVFRVVADVESYAQFVPWCTKSKVVEEINAKEKLADLTVGFHGLSEETFRSHVILEPFTKVTALASSELYSQSPVKRLKNVWTFEAVSDNETRVSNEIEFEFHNALYTRLTSHFLKRIANLAMSSFIARCALVKPLLDDPTTANEVQAKEDEKHEELVADHSFRGVRDTFKSLASSSHFEEYEIEILSRDFYRLADLEGSRLSKQALGKWLKQTNERAIDRIFLAMDVDKNGGLTLREFVRGTSLLCRGTPYEKRFAWFGDAPDNSISKEDLELAIMCTLVVSDTLEKTIAPGHTLSYYERPDLAAVRLVAPVFRNGSVNGKVLDRLFATL